MAEPEEEAKAGPSSAKKAPAKGGASAATKTAKAAPGAKSSLSKTTAAPKGGAEADDGAARQTATL